MERLRFKKESIKDQNYRDCAFASDHFFQLRFKCTQFEAYDRNGLPYISSIFFFINKRGSFLLRELLSVGERNNGY